jgi:hypothetical protein
MKRARWLMAVVILILGGLAGGWQNAAAQEKAEGEQPQFKLIGSAKCKICHQTKKQGDQYGIWQESAHAKAWEALASDQAKKIATERKLGDPQQAEECIGCHATKAFLGNPPAEESYEITEGVGCEACHGPGSEYKSLSVMRNLEKARSLGLQMHEGAEFCQKCHNEKSPTFESFDYKEQWAKIAHPIPKAEEPQE